MRGALPLLMLLGSAMLPLAARGQGANSSDSYLALVGATIYANPSDAPIRNGVVLIHSGKIVALGDSSVLRGITNIERIDCSGMTVTAGFWNSHVHFFERKWANAAEIPAAELTRQLEDFTTRWGFTSVFDLSSLWENTRRIRERIDSGEVAGPRILSTGEALVARGTLPPEIVMTLSGAMKVTLPEISTPEEATSAARKLLAEGVDAIKIHNGRTQMPPPATPAFNEEAVRAAVLEAHAAGKPAFVHPNTPAEILAAVRAGVDVVGHTTPFAGPWNDALLAAVREHKVALTPTLTIWKYFMRHDRQSTQHKIVETETEQLRAWVKQGGTVLFGTDLGAVDPDPSEEYALMAQSGMTFRQILASLTTAPAERFGAAEKLGRIAPGMIADVVVVQGDPEQDLRALTAVRYTVRAGQIIYRAR
ncbi:MAG TPA: amidohydrolase family protein [Terriglobales bacterium]|nr:amidohydrolase family protein [Terriglobales bacterium]